jgi:hypothetical protein
VKRSFVLIALLSAGCSAQPPQSSSKPVLTPADDGVAVQQVVLKLPGMV